VNSFGKSIIFEWLGEGDAVPVVPSLSKPALIALLCGYPENGVTLTITGEQP